MIFLIFFKENQKIFSQLKFETYYFLVFYLIILISLIFQFLLKYHFFHLFYFRYFLLAVGIYYLFKKYSFLKILYFFSLIFTFSLLTFDAIFQNIFAYNIIGYERGKDPTPYVTSFFDDEKKLGSFFVRLLPVLLSIIYFLDLKKFNSYIILIAGYVIF